MILYNGQTGSLGAYLGMAAATHGVIAQALCARLEDRASLSGELRSLENATSGDRQLSLIQMAAKVSVPACEQDPAGARRVNVDDTVATVEQIARWAAGAGKVLGVIYVSSGHVYAQQPPGMLTDEGAPVRPRSVYARTKWEAEESLGDLSRRLGFSLTVARVFGLVAPAQPAHYVLPSLMRRVREGRLRDIPGLSAVRDYLDARDVCDILIELSSRHSTTSGLFNVCSGRPVRIRDMLDAVVAQVQPDSAGGNRGAEVTEAPGRGDDVPWLVGDPARLTSLLGHPLHTIALHQTVSDGIRNVA